MTEPKYELWQEVYILENGKVKKTTIMEISIRTEMHLNKEQGDFTIASQSVIYWLSPADRSMYYEDRIYPTKESIIEWID